MQYDFDRKGSFSAKAAQEKKNAETKRLRVPVFCNSILYFNCCISLLEQQAKVKSKNKNRNSLSELKSTQAQLIQSEKMASWVNSPQALHMKYKTR